MRGAFLHVRDSSATGIGLLSFLLVAMMPDGGVAQPLPNPLHLISLGSLTLPNGAGGGLEYDGTNLVVDKGGAIRFLDPLSGTEIRSIPSTPQLTGMALYGGEIVTISETGVVSFVDPLTGAINNSYDLSVPLQDAPPNGIAVVGTELVVGHQYFPGDPTRDRVSVFDVATGSFLRTFADPGDSAHLGPDGGLMFLRGELWAVHHSLPNIERYSPVDGAGVELGVTPQVLIPGIHPRSLGITSDDVSKFFILNGNTNAIDVYGFTCGNGSIEPGEICDDGNVTNGDGCEDCTIQPTATPTSTRTALPTVTATVTPTSGPTLAAGCLNVPLETCYTATRNRVYVKNGGDPTKQRLTWQWRDGVPLLPGDFGDPVNGSTEYRLCVYDKTGGIATLKIGATVEPGGTCGSRPCWRALRDYGWKYRKSGGNAGGITLVQFVTRGAGNPHLLIKGKGAALPLPASHSATEFFDQDPTVIVQLHSSDPPRCWSSTFVTAFTTENSADAFSAKRQ